MLVSNTELRRGQFHRQEDVKEYKSVHQMIYYAIFHDQAKLAKVSV